MSDHTLLLLHGEEIVDASNNHVQLTNNGVVTSSAQSKFGGKSLYFNGSSYISFPELSVVLGSSDFTVDWWEYDTRTTGPDHAVRYASVSNSPPAFGGLLLMDEGVFAGSYANTSGAWDMLVSAPMMTSPPKNVWTHWAFVRSGSSFKSYKNGKLYNSQTLSKQIGSGDGTYKQTIGSWGPNVGVYGYLGYIDEFRISDIARWTSDFTPPDKPYVITEPQKENSVMIGGTIYKIEGGNAMINGAIRKVKRGNVLVSGTVRQIKLFASLFIVKVNFDPMANDIIIKTSINDDELVPFSMYSFGPGTNIIFTRRASVGNDNVYLNGKLVGRIDDATTYVYDRGNDIKLEYGQRDTLHGLFIDER